MREKKQSGLKLETAKLNKLYLSNLISVADLDISKANIITSKTGSGKTTFAFNKIAPNFAKGKTLYLIDTTAGKQQLLKKNSTKQFSNL